MIQLIFTVCSIVQGAACHKLPPIPLDEGVGMMGCMIASQQIGAKYAIEHPNHYVSRATCKPVSNYANL